VNNIAFVTYTHENASDLWKPYFDSLDEYASGIKSYCFSNKITSDFDHHIFMEYDDNKNYCQEFIRNLKNIEEEYFIYMQEDFFLYRQINQQKIEDYLDLLKDTNFSFIRLLKCGDVSNIKLHDDLYFVTDPGKKHASINSFSMQPTIWRKKDFISLYEIANNDRFGEYWTNLEAMNKLNLLGLYCYNEESKRGMDHYDSSVFPYIATAIIKGKWNTLEYYKELQLVFEKYNINKSIRGENK
jgi:hypothetical protein